ncbi:MAG: hypothetical protein DI565_02950 [Ancylobacter novellus]|uniref:Uncharacterized protein n=1 Tax=Ancylobacter novellus TaxID=921 RepID=A0A2W5KSC5_ANCNO|nr:MAG: hypothetical protein DI565_02950 [Ancylobacter novellus]
MKHLTAALASACLATSLWSVAPVRAAEDEGGFDAALHKLEIDWETAKFTIPEGSKQTARMDEVGKEADDLAARYPSMVEARIWKGILDSERASMAGPISALSLAKKARGVLETANQQDATALDAGAPTSLGVLYYRVPGFPLAFGDKDKARKLLEQATRSAPEGLDAWYFYGDFLNGQGEKDAAIAAFRHALAIPQHADRPLWDKNRRLVIKQTLAKLNAAS